MKGSEQKAAATLVCHTHLRMAVGIHLFTISAVSNYFTNLETQAENAEFDLWGCWSFLTGLSAP